MKLIARLASAASIVWLLCAAPPPVRFHAEPPEILAGDRALLCREGPPLRRATIRPQDVYMEPDKRPECVKVRPLQTTTFHINGRDGSGQLFYTDVTVKVKPATHITQFYASAGIVTPGESFLLCYGAEMAQSIRLIEPRVEELPMTANRCVNEFPRKTTRYMLEARGPSGRVVTESFQIKVSR